jgi:hypothetical protein
MTVRRLWPLLIGLVALSGCASVAIGEGFSTSSTVVSVASDAATTTTLAPETPTTASAPEPDDQTLAADSEAASDTPEPAQDENVYPVSVRITEIGVEAEIIDLGLNPDGSLEVPKDFAQTGWYTGRSVPGRTGPSVVVGHVDSTTGPAVFYRLGDLQAGHSIEIMRSDGSTAVFRVVGTEMVLKDEFPTEQVYGPTAQPTLRLITCGGDFDRSAQSYKGNLIVYAEHVGNFAPDDDSRRS